MVSDKLTETQEALTSEIRADQREHLKTMAEILHGQREQGKTLADAAGRLRTPGPMSLGQSDKYRLNSPRRSRSRPIRSVTDSATKPETSLPT